MKPETKLILKVISFIGLALSIIPSILFFVGTISRDNYLSAMVVGMFMWFGAAVFWVKKEDLG